MSKALATLDSLDEVRLTPFRSSMLDWMDSPEEVANFVETIARGGSILTYAKRRGLSFAALMMFLRTENGGKLLELIEMARVEANASKVAERLRRLTGQTVTREDGTVVPLGMSEAEKRELDAYIAAAKFANERRTKPAASTTNVNLKVSVNMAALHGRIQERRRAAGAVIDSTAVEIQGGDDD